MPRWSSGPATRSGGKALLEKFDPRVGTGGPAKDTTTCVVADRHGNVVAATPSGFSGALAGKTGVYLGSRLQSFNNWAGHPNCIEPGKRPRITLTPTLVLKDGKPVLAVSVAGGDMQDQTTLQMLMNVIDFGLEPGQGGDGPALRHQPPPRLVPPDAAPTRQPPARPRHSPRASARSWPRAGTRSARSGPGSNPVLIRIDPKTGMIHAAGDPRSRRHAAAY